MTGMEFLQGLFNVDLGQEAVRQSALRTRSARKKLLPWATSDGRVAFGVTRSEARAYYKRRFGPVPKGTVFVQTADVVPFTAPEGIRLAAEGARALHSPA